MKKVTVNGNDHELSPDSPRSRSHVELLQDMVTSINNLETGTTPDGIELTSTQSAKNVISSYTTDADTTNAALTFHNTVANGSNELEFNFTDNANASLLKIDNEGDVTIAGGLTCTTVTASGALSAAGISSSGATTALTSTSANLITSATSDANTTAAVAGLTFKNTTAHTSGDLEFNFVRSDDTSLLNVDKEGDATLGGSLTFAGATAPVVTSSATAGNISGDTAALNFQHTATLNADTLAYAFKNQSGTKLFWIDRVGNIFNNGNAYLGNVAFGADYRALPLAGTLGSGTGITTNVSSALRHLFHKITVTEAALTDADTSQAVTIWTAPAKARILRIVADVTTAFTGGGVTACTLQVGIAGGDTDAYIVASDVFSGAVTLGDVEADLGTALSNAGTGVGAYPNWGGTQAIAAQFDTVTANVADLTAGSVTFYIEYVSYAE